jgi:hypothetical protein
VTNRSHLELFTRLLAVGEFTGWSVCEFAGGTICEATGLILRGTMRLAGWLDCMGAKVSY